MDDVVVHTRYQHNGRYVQPFESVTFMEMMLQAMGWRKNLIQLQVEIFCFLFKKAIR